MVILGAYPLNFVNKSPCVTFRQLCEMVVSCVRLQALVWVFAEAVLTVKQISLPLAELFYIRYHMEYEGAVVLQIY